MQSLYKSYLSNIYNFVYYLTRERSLLWYRKIATKFDTLSTIRIDKQHLESIYTDFNIICDLNYLCCLINVLTHSKYIVDKHIRSWYATNTTCGSNRSRYPDQRLINAESIPHPIKIYDASPHLLRNNYNTRQIDYLRCPGC